MAKAMHKKRERVEHGRENSVVMKYGFHEGEFQWIIAVTRQINFQILSSGTGKLEEFSYLSSCTK